MNKKIFINFVLLGVTIFIGFFVLVQPVQAGTIQFGDKNIFVNFDGLPFNLSNWAPGMVSSPKTITITNNENFDINIYFKARKTSGDDILAHALTVTVDDKSKYLSDLFNNNIALTSVNSGKNQDYNLTLTFDQDADNDCQNKIINFDFIITAEQIGKGGEEISSVVIPGGGAVYIPPTTPITNTGKVVTTPGEGGIASLTNPDGSKIELIVPAGAVSKNTIFTIKKVGTNLITPPNPEIGLFLVNGLVYEIKAQRGGELITTFNKPFTLTFHYTDKQMEGLDENSLQIYYWDNEQNRWIVVGNSQVDKGKNTVTISVDHLTIFALTGSKIGFAGEKAKKGEKPPEEIGISEKIKEIPKRITEKIKKVAERITPSAPTAEAGKPSVAKKVGLPEKKTVPVAGKPPQRSLSSMFASLGMAWQGISQSVLLSTLLIICLLLLALLFLREYKLFRKKRE